MCVTSNKSDKYQKISGGLTKNLQCLMMVTLAETDEQKLSQS